MGIDYDDKPDGNFDPAKIPSNKKLVRRKNNSGEVKEHPSKTNSSRSPLLAGIVGAVSKTGVATRMKIRSDTKTLAETKYNAQARAELAKAQRKEAEEKTELYERQSEERALWEESDEEVDFNKKLRSQRRKNKLAKAAQKGESAQFEHDKKVRPHRKSTISKEDRIREEMAQYAQTGVGGIHVQIAREEIQRDIDKNGGVITEEQQCNYDDMLNLAKKRDLSKG